MEEFMKNLWFYVGGCIAFVCAASYIIYKRFVNTSISNDKVSVLKKHIEALSYEFLIEEAKKMVSNMDQTELNAASTLSMAVVPNRLALQFISTPDSEKWLGSIDLTEDEKKEMVILTIKETDRVLLSEILIPDRIMDDYYDFVPNDKIYVKKIVLKK